ncbi:MAG: hypothetical protein FJX03_03020 [Alphaproteobacteria bacterium]|nr:hypothetical protein [Alphaproteobacteria bacterium]
MIWFFSMERASGGVCDSYDELFQCLYKLNVSSLSDISVSPTHTPSTQTAPFCKKQWCIDYCKTNKYIVMESFN